MKRNSLMLGCLLSLVAVPSIAGPVTKVASLSPRYNSEVIEIQWTTAVTGGCSTSTAAVTNAGAANAKALTTFLLAALATGADVEVTFGGGCDGSSNWIQTVRLIQ
jgi:hypothetical protein